MQKIEHVIESDGNLFFHEFHSTCPWLGGKDPAFLTITLRQAEEKGLRPCPVCFPRSSVVRRPDA